MTTLAQASVRRLGPGRYRSPLHGTRFVHDDARILLDVHAPAAGDARSAASLEEAGPRELLYFDPARTRCAILSAGGICPGINDVIRGIVMELHYRHGVRGVVGLRHGFASLLPGAAEPLELMPDDVASIHQRGGTFLGTGRDRPDVSVACDAITEAGYGALFCIGGDGTFRAAVAIDHELARRGVDCAVVGIPKTIDNDILHCSRTFGFMTAVEEATRVITAAHVEATGHRNGVGLVKLMGRESGFIAATATLACPDVNFCLVNEVAWELDGPAGLLAALRDRLALKRHAVIVVAEGAALNLWPADRLKRDDCGNLELPDVGPFLRDAIVRQFAEWREPVTVKYIDPSYLVRSVPANVSDHLLCGHLAKMAVHAAMAGRSGLMIGLWNDAFVHVPLATAVAGRKRIDPDGLSWQGVLASTGQPSLVN